MPYTPSELTISSWSVPLSINSSDDITDLDDAVNTIMDTGASSVKNFINGELSKIPTYLSSELDIMYANLGESMAHKWAEEDEDVEVDVGEYSAKHWATKAGALLSGLTASYAELNVLDGITSTTSELNILHGVTASTAELNILDGVTASTADLNKTTKLTSGTWTPSVTASLNVDSTSISVDSWTYTRVGNIVTVSGYIEIQASLADVSTYVMIDMPVASSFSYHYNANGVAGASHGVSATGVVQARTAQNDLQIQVNPNTTALTPYRVQAQYTVA